MTPRIASRLSCLLVFVLLLAPGTQVDAESQEAPFSLPLPGEPGPSSWFVIQWYGNTISAAMNAEDLYSRGQGIHFGVDFAAPCGTEVVAIGDGEVFAVDGPYGSAPHNVVVRHDNGYYSLYGHLQVRSDLREGQWIHEGERVGQIGDPAGPDCVRAPHLHLEIRTDGMTQAVNPVPLIDTDWRQVEIGASGYGGGFAVDFAEPSKWQRTHDQPGIRFQGPILNEYVNEWLVR